MVLYPAVSLVSSNPQGSHDRAARDARALGPHDGDYHAFIATKEKRGVPGGPFWKKKDHGAWTIPKGLIAFGESPLDAAKREFEEETGYRPGGDFIALGHAKQPGGKTVHIWAVEDDWNPEELKSIRSRWNGRLVRASTRISPRLSGHRGSKQGRPADEF